MHIERFPVSDAALLDYLKENLAEIKFIGCSPDLATKDLIKELHSGTPLDEQRSELVELWRPLLGDAIVFLKRKDIREEYNDEEIYGVSDLAECFRQIEKFEGVLFGNKPSYRDHVTHTFRVFLLGLYVIGKAIGFPEVNCDDSLLSKKITADEKKAMWAIIALCHDLGYPLQSIRSVSDSTRTMLEKFGRLNIQELAYELTPQFHTISDFVLRLAASTLEKRDEDKKQDDNKFYVHLQPKYFIKFVNALDEYQHGVLSCLVLMKKLVYFLESDYTMDDLKSLDEDDSRQYLIRRNILRAIASHDCEEIYHLTINNFPFLLLVCDEMQEWGRPRQIDLFGKVVPKVRLTINRFDKSSVNYEIEFSRDMPDEGAAAGVKKYFDDKTRKFIKVLRSAVGKDRAIHFVFMVKDRAGESVEEYELDHKNPSEFKITRPRQATKTHN